jgi:hypothetical protein
MHQSYSKGLSESKACVKVYSSTGLVKMYQVPVDRTGLYWKVFQIENGDIRDVNEIGDE